MDDVIIKNGGIRNADMYGKDRGTTPKYDFKIKNNNSSDLIKRGIEPYYSDLEGSGTVRTNQGINSNSKYDRWLHGYGDYDDVMSNRGDQQTFFDKLGNGLAKASIYAGTSFIRSSLGVAAGLVGLASGDGFSAMHSNFVNDVMHDIEQWSEEVMPLYTSDKEKNQGFLGQTIGSTNWWMEFMKSVGIMAGSAAAGKMYAGAFGALSRGLKGSLSQQRSMLTSNLLTSILTASGEAGMEAQEAKENTYNSQMAIVNENYNKRLQDITNKYAQGSDEYNKALTQLNKLYSEAKTQAEEIAMKAADATYGWNIPQITAQNLFFFGKMFGRSFNKTIALKNEAKQLANSKVKGTLGNYRAAVNKNSVLRRAALGPVGEAVEEMNQNAFKRGSEMYYLNSQLLDPDAEATDTYGNFLNSAWSSFRDTYTDREAWKEGLAGAIMGISGAISFRSPYNTTTKKIQNPFSSEGSIFSKYKEAKAKQRAGEELAKKLNDISAGYSNMTDIQKQYARNGVNEEINNAYKEYADAMNKAKAAATTEDNAEATNNQETNAEDVPTDELLQKYKELLGSTENDGSLEGIYGTAKYYRNFVDKHNDLARLFQYRQDQEEALEERDMFKFKNAEFAELFTHINTFAKAGRLNDMKEMIRTVLNPEDATTVNNIIQETSRQNKDNNNKLEGPYISSDGNMPNLEDVKEQITENRDYLLDQINSYSNYINVIRTITNSKSSTPLSDKQVQELAYMRMAIDNMEDRAQSLVDKLKEGIDNIYSKYVEAGAAVPTITEDKQDISEAEKKSIEETKKAQEEYETITKALEAITSSINMHEATNERSIDNVDKLYRLIQPLYSQIDANLLNNPSLDSAQSTHERMEDLAALTEAIEQYYKTYNDYIKNPEVINNSVKENNKKKKERKKEKVKEKQEINIDAIINNPETTVGDLLRAIDNFGADMQSTTGDDLFNPYEGFDSKYANNKLYQSARKVVNTVNNLKDAIDEVTLTPEYNVDEDKFEHLKNVAKQALDEFKYKINTNASALNNVNNIIKNSTAVLRGAEGEIDVMRLSSILSEAWGIVNKSNITPQPTQNNTEDKAPTQSSSNSTSSSTLDEKAVSDMFGGMSSEAIAEMYEDLKSKEGLNETNNTNQESSSTETNNTVSEDTETSQQSQEEIQEEASLDSEEKNTEESEVEDSVRPTEDTKKLEEETNEEVDSLNRNLAETITSSVDAIVKEGHYYFKSQVSKYDNAHLQEILKAHYGGAESIKQAPGLVKSNYVQLIYDTKAIDEDYIASGKVDPNATVFFYINKAFEDKVKEEKAYPEKLNEETYTPTVFMGVQDAETKSIVGIGVLPAFDSFQSEARPIYNAIIKDYNEGQLKENNGLFSDSKKYTSKIYRIVEGYLSFDSQIENNINSVLENTKSDTSKDFIKIGYDPEDANLQNITIINKNNINNKSYKYPIYYKRLSSGKYLAIPLRVATLNKNNVLDYLENSESKVKLYNPKVKKEAAVRNTVKNITASFKKSIKDTLGENGTNWNKNSALELSKLFKTYFYSVVKMPKNYVITAMYRDDAGAVSVDKPETLTINIKKRTFQNGRVHFEYINQRRISVSDLAKENGIDNVFNILSELFISIEPGTKLKNGTLRKECPIYPDISNTNVSELKEVGKYLTVNANSFTEYNPLVYVRIPNTAESNIDNTTENTNNYNLKEQQIKEDNKEIKNIEEGKDSTDNENINPYKIYSEDSKFDIGLNNLDDSNSNEDTSFHKVSEVLKANNGISYGSINDMFINDNEDSNVEDGQREEYLNTVIDYLKDAGISVQTVHNNDKIGGTPLYNNDRVVYGYVKDGVIYVNEDIATAETPIHEYTHLWVSALKIKDNAKWQSIVNSLKKDEEAWNYIKKTYPELSSEEDIAEEILATLSGKRGLQRLENDIKNSVKKKDVKQLSFFKRVLNTITDALHSFWNSITSILGFNSSKAYTDILTTLDNIYDDIINKVGVENMALVSTSDAVKKHQEVVNNNEDIESIISDVLGANNPNTNLGALLNNPNDLYAPIITLNKILKDDSLNKLINTISKNNRALIEKYLNKNTSLTDCNKGSIITYLRSRPPVEQLSLAKWIGNNTVNLAEDLELCNKAFSLSKKYGKDPAKYDSPGALLNEIREVNSEENQEEENHAYLSPEDSKFRQGLFTEKTQYEDVGITVYTVEDSKEGQQAVRDLMNDHLTVNGDYYNCWCLLMCNSKGELTDNSWTMWNHYNATEKKIALDSKGKICAFYASTEPSGAWWDLNDYTHDNSIPISTYVPNDKLNRKSTLDYNPTTKETVLGDYLFKGSKRDGLYEVWSLDTNKNNPNKLDNYYKSLSDRYKKKKLDGESIRYDEEGNIIRSYIYKNGFITNSDAYYNWNKTTKNLYINSDNGSVFNIELYDNKKTGVETRNFKLTIEAAHKGAYILKVNYGVKDSSIVVEEIYNNKGNIIKESIYTNNKLTNSLLTNTSNGYFIQHSIDEYSNIALKRMRLRNDFLEVVQDLKSNEVLSKFYKTKDYCLKYNFNKDGSIGSIEVFNKADILIQSPNRTIDNEAIVNKYKKKPIEVINSSDIEYSKYTSIYEALNTFMLNNNLDDINALTDVSNLPECSKDNIEQYIKCHM